MQTIQNQESQQNGMGGTQPCPKRLLLHCNQLEVVALTLCAGYGTEAVSYIAGLLQSQLVDPRDVWIAQVRRAWVCQEHSEQQPSAERGKLYTVQHAAEWQGMSSR
jgi:hypothetical protein